MTREEAKKFWPIIKAWSEGKTVQLKLNNEWSFDCIDNVLFSDGPDQYRIKPEPKLRPWKPEEVPVGALLRSRDRDRRGEYRYLLTGYSGPPVDRIFVGTCGDASRYSFEQALENYEHSTDNGKTWHPCGVEE